MSTWTVVLAAGAGSRFAGLKQFAEVGGVRAVDRVVRTARAVSDGVVLVLPAPAGWDGPTVDTVVAGGASRAASVRAGLAAVPENAAVILVHDAAHPLASIELFESVLRALAESRADAAMPALPVVEALKRVSGPLVVGHLARDGVMASQTPHAFRAAALRAAHVGAPEAVEDIELVCAQGGRAVFVPGDPRNIHITTPAELELADELSSGQAGYSGL